MIIEQTKTIFEITDKLEVTCIVFSVQIYFEKHWSNYLATKYFEAKYIWSLISVDF